MTHPSSEGPDNAGSPPDKNGETAESGHDRVLDSLGDGDTFTPGAGSDSDVAMDGLELEAGAGQAEHVSPDDSLLSLGGRETLAAEFGITQELANRYEVLEELGRGGMGVVYKARDRLLGRLVALKRLTTDIQANQRAIDRFWAEAQTIASLTHHNSVRIYNLVQDELGLCIELEFVEGGDLQQRIAEEGALPAEQVADIGSQLCDALAEAHEKGIVHRDIKPANVLLTKGGMPKLSDFGLARPVEGLGTVTGAVMGTMHYAAPEQLVSGKDVDARADVYSLGATLYALATGEAPRTVRLERVPEELRDVIGRCLEENPGRRYPSAAALKEALEKGGARAARVEAGACPKCGKANPADVRFCQKCGADLSELFRPCPRCRRENRLDVEFCGSCGANLTHHFAIQGLLEEARRLNEAQDLDAALEKCEEALQLDPRHPGAGALANQYRTKHVRLTSNLKLAAGAEAQGRVDDAIGAYRRVLEVQPDHGDAVAAIERLHQAKAEAERREKQQRVAELAGEVKAAREKKDYVAAIAACRAILEVQPEHPGAKEHLPRLEQRRIRQLAEQARATRAKGGLDRALALCGAILEIEPDNEETLAYIGKLKAQQVERLAQAMRVAARDGRTEEALDLARQVRDAAPDHPAAAEARALEDTIERRRLMQEARTAEHEWHNQAQAAEILRRACDKWPCDEEIAQELERLERALAAANRRAVLIGLGTAMVLAGSLLAGLYFVFNKPGTGPKPPAPGIRSTPGGIAGATQRQRATAPGGQTERTLQLASGVDMDMVWVPPGEFVMGSAEGEVGHYIDEAPQHTVRISQGFWMGKHEVSQVQWHAVMGDNPSRFAGPDNPVECVSWEDCHQFAARLGQTVGGAFRLPTEAEWEYACRAGSVAPYCYGGDPSALSSYAWYDENSGDEPQPAGVKQPNAWGLHDMHGNVWEWCEDVYEPGYYSASPDTDPCNRHAGASRVLRGGGFCDSAQHCRAADRFSLKPGEANFLYGLRIVCEP